MPIFVLFIAVIMSANLGIDLVQGKNFATAYLLNAVIATGLLISIFAYISQDD